MAACLCSNHQRRKLSSEICSLRTQAAAIQKQAAALFTPATFAKCAKLERQSLARDKEAEQKQEELDKLPSTRIALVLRVMKVRQQTECRRSPDACCT